MIPSETMREGEYRFGAVHIPGSADDALLKKLTCASSTMSLSGGVRFGGVSVVKAASLHRMHDGDRRMWSAE